MIWWNKNPVKKLIISRPSKELVEPSAEEARGWVSMGVSKYYKAQLVEKLEVIKDNWVNGDYTGSSIEETIQLNSEALGKAGAIAEELLTLEEMTIDEEETEN